MKLSNFQPAKMTLLDHHFASNYYISDSTLVVDQYIDMADIWHFFLIIGMGR